MCHVSYVICHIYVCQRCQVPPPCQALHRERFKVLHEHKHTTRHWRCGDSSKPIFLEATCSGSLGNKCLRVSLQSSVLPKSCVPPHKRLTCVGFTTKNVSCEPLFRRWMHSGPWPKSQKSFPGQSLQNNGRCKQMSPRAEVLFSTS